MPYTIEELKANPDYHFRCTLHDTILLLGGRLDIANMLDESLDKPFTYEQLCILLQYTIDLFAKHKGVLRNLHSEKIQVVKPEDL